jgi:hypothetical protein
MAAPGTAPERFVMVGADSDAAPSGEHRTCRKKYGRAERARSFGFRAVIAAESRHGQLNDCIRFRQGPGAAIYAVQGFRGVGVQGSRGSGGQEVTGVQGFTGGFTVQTGGRGLGIGLGTADVALIQKFIVHRIHTPTVDLDEAELNSLNLWNLMNR